MDEHADISLGHALRCSRVAKVALVYSLVFYSWMIFRWGPSDHRILGDAFNVLLNSASAILCWRAARRCGPIPALRQAWAFIALGTSSYALGNVSQFSYEAILGHLPYPSITDFLYVATYPLMFAGLLRFPTVRASGLQKMQMVSDAALLLVGGAMLLWYFYLGPTIAQAAQGPVLSGAVSIAYPVGDLVVIAGLAGLINRGTVRSSQAALRVFVVAICAFVAADLTYGIWTLMLHRTYSGGDFLDGIWWLGLLGWGLAGSLQPVPCASEMGELHERLITRRRPSWLPYLAMFASLALLIVVTGGSGDYAVLSVAIGTALCAVLVAIRQMAAHQELLGVQRELRVAHDELAALATSDPLTGLPNHRTLVDAIDAEVARSARYRQPMVTAFIDLDHFKALNDTLGHAAGDAALRELAALLRSCLRTTDTVGRWGGEEFVVLLPQTTAEGATSLLERVRLAVAEHRFAAAGGAHLTCSIGIAARPGDGLDRDTLLEAADRAMYAAKHLGRNQVVAAAEAAVLARSADAGQDRDEQAMLGAVDALAAMVDARDAYTGAHSAEVQALCRRLALVLGADVNTAHVVGIAARLHDIGKVAVPDSVLNKPGALDEREWELMRQHPVIGAEIAARVPRLRSAVPAIRGHHERYDGGGYPDGLAGEDIPLAARIIAVADAFSAMVTDRPYRPARPLPEAVEELHRCAGSQFDPAVVGALESVLETGEIKLAA